jgi:transketolase
MKTKQIRQAYGEALVRIGEKDKRIIVLDSDVSNSTKSCLFGEKFPERFFNVGISEANMAGMAAGFATTGKIPFINTFANFMVLRAGDPIHSLIAYTNLNVKIAGAYSGLSDSYDGASHHSLIDIAFMRALPNMSIISVSDPVETEKSVKACLDIDGPVYLRLSRAEMPYIYDNSYNFEFGKGNILVDGSDLTIIATGYMVHKALEAAKLLKNEGINARVVNIHTIKPIDTELLLKCAKETGTIVTVEEHSIFGGLGAAVAEVIVRNYPVPMEIVGIEDVFCESGGYEELLNKYGLCAENIVAKSKLVLSRKYVEK